MMDGYRRWAGRALPGVLVAILAHAAGAQGSLDQKSPVGPVARVAMLAVAGRTSVVVELTEAPAKVALLEANPTSVVVEAGPFTAPIQAQELTPASGSPLVAGVSVSGSTQPDGTTRLRIRVTLQSEAAHRLRFSGTRVYLDFWPSDTATGRLAPETARNVEVPRRGTARQESPTGDGRGASDEKAAPLQLTDAEREAAYGALETTTLARARPMAARPDVKGLVRLRNEVTRRDVQLGQGQPDRMTQLMTELQRLTDEARALQLERDKQLFLK